MRSVGLAVSMALGVEQVYICVASTPETARLPVIYKRLFFFSSEILKSYSTDF